MVSESGTTSEYQLKDRLSFMRFCGLALHDPVPDAKTIWLSREQLTRGGAIERLFARFDAILRARGYVAMGGQIVDATVVEARRPRLNRAEKDTIKGGDVPPDGNKGRTRQIDRDGRWTLKRGKKRSLSEDGGVKRPATTEIVIPAFGYEEEGWGPFPAPEGETCQA
jgi:transposase, IS5 family